MTQIEYKKMSLKEMQSRKWETCEVIGNGNMQIPSGSAVDITDKRGGLRLIGPRCTHCGIRIYITKVSPYSVREV